MKTFTAGDKEIVRFVNEFRLVTIEHLEGLTGRKTIWRRLPVLLAEKQVYKKERGINEKYVYSCTPLHKRSVFTIDHDLMITDIHVALHKTGTLIYWEQGKDCWKDRVHQDAFCTLNIHTSRTSTRLTISLKPIQGRRTTVASIILCKRSSVV